MIKIIPLIAGIKAFLLPFSDDGKTTIDLIKEGKYKSAVNRIIMGLTGFDVWQGKFDFMRLKEGLLPLIGAGIASKFLRKLGVNKYIKQGSMGVLELA